MTLSHKILIAFLFGQFCSLTNGAEVLRLSHTNGPTGARHESCLLFSELVSEYTHGEVEVQVFHSGQIANDPKAIELLKLGGLDFTVTSTGSYAPHLPALNLLFLPYLVDNFEQGWRLYDESPWVQDQFDDLADRGIRILAVWEAGFRHFTTVMPLPYPSEANNEKMRVFPNETLRSMVESLGFNPVIIPAPEVYLALQQGTVIGQENPVDTIYSLRFYEVAPFLTLTSHIYGPIPFSIAESTWQRLSDEHQQAIKKAAKEAGQYCREKVVEQEPQQIEEMKSNGITLYTPDLAPYREAVGPVYEQARQTYGSNVDALLADAQAIRESRELTDNSDQLSEIKDGRLLPMTMISFFVSFTFLVILGYFLQFRHPGLIPQPTQSEHPWMRFIGIGVDWSICWCGAGIIILMFGNVLSRFLLKFDVDWTSELSVFLMVWSVFLGAVAATRRRTQMRIAEGIGLIPAKPRKPIGAFVQAFTLLVLFLLIYHGIGIVDSNLNQQFVALGWPMGWQYAAMPVGAALALPYAMKDFIDTLNGKLDPGSSSHDTDI